MKCDHSEVWFGDGTRTTNHSTTTWCQTCGSFRLRKDAEWMKPTNKKPLDTFGSQSKIQK